MTVGQRHVDWEKRFWKAEKVKFFLVGCLLLSILTVIVKDGDLKYFTISKMHAKFPEMVILAVVCIGVAFCSMYQFYISHWHKRSNPSINQKTCFPFCCVTWVNWRLIMEVLSNFFLIMVGIIPMVGGPFDNIHCFFAVLAMICKLFEHHLLMFITMFIGLIGFLVLEFHTMIHYSTVPSPLLHSTWINILVFSFEVFVLLLLAFRQVLDYSSEYLFCGVRSLDRYIDEHHVLGCSVWFDDENE
jgi:hypothetical protein